jgi:hypothetical protein
MRNLFTAILLAVFFSASALADEIRPGYLELTTSDGATYSVKWKVPMKGDLVLSLQPVLPVNCEERTLPSSMATGGAMITRWSLHCPGGVYGGRIAIDGLNNTMTDVLVRVVHENGVTQMERLTSGDTGFQYRCYPGLYGTRY